MYEISFWKNQSNNSNSSNHKKTYSTLPGFKLNFYYSKKSYGQTKNKVEIVQAKCIDGFKKMQKWIKLTFKNLYSFNIWQCWNSLKITIKSFSFYFIYKVPIWCQLRNNKRFFWILKEWVRFLNWDLTQKSLIKDRW